MAWLWPSTLDVLASTGLEIYVSWRSYVARSGRSEVECPLIRAQETARCVEHVTLDARLTGLD